MDTTEYTDRALLTLLDRDREQAAAILLERYSGILWSVCAHRLSDPEDVKECVNAVFADFCLNPTLYDPEKGSLRAYLCGMANRKALERHRKNEVRLRAEGAVRQASGSRNLPVEDTGLEEALTKLEPEDAQILRMKYYGGMTYPEIARALGLKTETAKKRGQRGLSKMKFLLLGLLIALLIAGCAYLLRRYYYARDFGVYADPEAPVYQLEELPEACSRNGLTLHLLNAVYQEETLTLELAYTAGEELYPTDTDGSCYDLSMNTMSLYHWYIQITDSTGSSQMEALDCPVIVYTQSQYVVSANIPLPAEEDGTISLELLLKPDREAGSIDYYRRHPEAQPVLDQTPAVFQVTLVPIQAVKDPSQLGAVMEAGNARFLFDEPIQEDGWTKLPFYPLELPDGYRLSPVLYNYYVTLFGYEDVSASLTGQDGTVYSAIRAEGPSVAASQRNCLWFRDVPPGDYTLQIPRICYLDGHDPAASQDSPSAVELLALPQEDDVWVPCDKTVTFFDGSSLQIRAIRRTVVTSDTVYDYQDNAAPDGGQTELSARQVEYRYQLSYSLTSAGPYPLVSVLMNQKFYHDTEAGPELIRKDTFVRYGSSLSAEYAEFTLSVYEGLDMAPPDQLELILQTPVYLDNQSYSFCITIPQSE